MVGNSSWLTRGALPLIAALTAAPVLSLPADAQVSAPVSGTSPGIRAAAGPSLATEWWLNSLGAQQAWGAAPQKGAGITVAVLSTGVSPAQQDLTGNVIPGPDYTGSGRHQGGPYWGAEGTAVASLIAGHGHGAGGSAGITGIAPRARVLSVRVTLDRGDPMLGQTAVTRRLPDAIARGIGYAVTNGAKVIVLPPDPVPGANTAEQAAIREAAAQNVVLVAPAGDNGAASRPAGYSGAVMTGATGSDGKLAPFSGTGSGVTLTAPGDNLTAAAPGGGYVTLSSTDASAALTGGLAALVLARYPQLSAAEVTQALTNGVTAGPGMGQRPGTGAGEVSAAGTITAAASIFSLNGNPAPDPAPAWQKYANNGHARSDSGLLSTQRLTEAGIGLGVLVVVILIVGILIGRRRRDDDGLVWGYPAGTPAGQGPAPRELAVPPAPPALNQGNRVSAIDALSRNTGVQVPVQGAGPVPGPKPPLPRRHAPEHAKRARQQPRTERVPPAEPLPRRK